MHQKDTKTSENYRDLGSLRVNTAKAERKIPRPTTDLKLQTTIL